MTAVTTPDPGVRDTILNALDLQIPRPNLSAPYRLGLFLVAVVMVLLPLVYLALVVLAAYGVYWHATENLVIFEEVRSKRNAAFAYLTPLIVGTILVFFMVKPILAPRATRPEPFEADPERQPFLYAFVRSLCAAVGAPAPRRILLDCEANASAGFHQGGLGLTTRGRELTIGLPLVSAMSVRQLAGVLAHEFGHFSQGVAMRLSFVVMAVNSWFARVVFERDSWDQKLIDWSRGSVYYLSWPAGLARGCVWLTRKLLHGLMWIGHVVSSNMSRQMEYDADTFEIRLAGSKSFCESMVKVVELGTAQGWAVQELKAAWEQRQVADDFPRLVLAQYDEMNDDVRQRIRASLEQEETSLFASHPRAFDRMSVAIQAAEDGAFAVDAPSTVLFDDFPATCKAASVSHYHGLIGRHFKTEYLVDLDAFLAERQQADAERGAARRFFQGTANIMHPLAIPTTFDGDPAGELQALRAAMVEQGPRFPAALQRLIDVHNRLTANELARIWIDLGVKISIAEFELDAADEESVDQQAARLTPQLRSAQDEIVRLLALPGRRIAGALAAGSDLPAAGELHDMVDAANRIGAVVPNVVLLRGRLTILSELFGHETDEERDKQKLNRHVDRNAHRLQEELDAIHEQLGDTRYPFRHSAGAVPARDVALPEVPDPDDLGALWDAAVKAEDTLSGLYSRILGRIALLCEQIESARGLAPLPEPEPPSEPGGE